MEHTAPTPVPAPPTLLDLRAAARYLAVSEHTFRRWCEQGRLPVIRYGARLRFDRADLDAYLAAARVPATAGPLATPGGEGL